MSYASLDLDVSDEHSDQVEDIRVWDITASGATGHISATRKTHQHFCKSSLEPSHKGSPAVDDIGAPADLEPNELPPAESVAKRKRAKIVKENDSVSSIAVS